MTHTKHTLLCIDSIDIPTQSWTVTLCFKDLLPFTFVIWECMHKCLIRLDPMFFCPDIGTMCIPKLWTVMYFINFPWNYITQRLVNPDDWQLFVSQYAETKAVLNVKMKVFRQDSNQTKKIRMIVHRFTISKTYKEI